MRMKSSPSSRRQSAKDTKSYGGGEGSWFWILLWSGRSPWCDGDGDWSMVGVGGWWCFGDGSGARAVADLETAGK